MRFKYFIPVLASAALLLTACDDVFTPAIENFKDIDMVNKEPDFAKGFLITRLPHFARLLRQQRRGY